MAILRTICWALLFILKLRFPPGQSLVDILKKRYNNGALAAFRKFQRLDLKLAKAKLDLEFLTNCKKHYVIPKFLNFKCPYRFQTVFYQAGHHKNVHNSEHPFYCVPCSTRDEENETRRIVKTCAFKDEKTLRNHGTLMKHTMEEMFLNEGTSLKPTAKSFAINYC